MKDTNLKKARVYFFKKKYEDAIELLNPLEAIYQDSFEYYYYLGFSYFFLKEYTKAYTFLKGAQIIKKENPNTYLGIAIIFLRRKNFEKAIECWLSILDFQKNNKQAKYALKLFSKLDLDAVDFETLQKSGKLKRLYPKFPIYIPPIFYYIIILICLGALSFYSYPKVSKILKARFVNYREGIEKIQDLQKNITFSDSQNYSLIKFSKEEIEDLTNEIIVDFSNKKDNIVRYKVNKILLSNASYYVKQKAKEVLNYLSVPDFTNFKDEDNFDYKDIEKNILLYNGVYVKWKGSVSNLNRLNKYLSFDFLLGYQNHKEVKALIPTIFKFPIDVENGFSVEIIAKVGVLDNQLKLEGSSVRRLKTSKKERDS